MLLMDKFNIFSKRSALIIGLAGYCSSLLFNGLIRHLGISFPVVNVVRPYLPEFFLLLFFIGCFTRKLLFRNYEVAWWVNFFAVSIISVGYAPSIKSILSVIRDLIEPFLLLIVLSSCHLKKENVDRIMILMRNIFALFIIVGFIFAILQYFLGWEWTSEYFAGYSFYGLNKDESLRISHGWIGFKVLGTTGSAETFGFYNAYAILYMLFYGFSRRIVNFFLVTLSIVSLLLTSMKTPILIASLILIVYIRLSLCVHFSYLDWMLICLIGFSIFLFMIYSTGSWEESSIYERFILWDDLFHVEHLENIIIPHNLFYYSAGSGNTGIISFWDNTYLYILFSLGILGFIFTIYYIYKIYEEIMNYDSDEFVLFVCLFLFLASFTTCIFFGRLCINFMFIVLGIKLSCARRFNYEKDICDVC